MLNQFNLNGNPFEMKTVHDIKDFTNQPFLLMSQQKVLKTKLDLNAKSPFPIYHILLGERGAGKSSTLLYLYKSLTNGNTPIDTKSFYTNKLVLSVSSLVDVLGIRAMEGNSINAIKSYVAGKKIYLFIDVPDRVSNKVLSDYLGILETILEFKEISVIMAVNKSYYNQSFSHSEILGKYTSSELEPFSLQETEELIRERINNFEIKKNNDLKPFTEGSIKKVFSFSGGIPRNTLSACDLLFLSAIEREQEVIDGTFTTRILQTDFAFKIIQERIKEPTKREMLAQMFEIIKNKFNGVVIKEKGLVNLILKEQGWSPMTTRKRIRELEKIGLLEIKKDKKDMWSNVITLRG